VILYLLLLEEEFDDKKLSTVSVHQLQRKQKTTSNDCKLNL